MDNNRNMMELNTEENQKKRERKEKVDNIKKKFKNWKEQRQEAKEDRIRAKEEKARVKEENRREKEAKKNKKKHIEEDSLGEKDSFSSLGEHTITNETIMKESTPKITTKKTLSPTEAKKRKLKRQKLIRNIMTIPEIIIVIFLAIFCKNKYIEYSENVHQILSYTSGNYIYEIRRDNNHIKVLKNVQESCTNPPCTTKNISEYEIKFGKNKMKVLRLYMDLEFKFKSSNKSITLDDLNTELGKKSIYSMIHNDGNFISFENYKKYSVVDYEQMSNFATKGYKFVPKNTGGTLYIAMGEKTTRGYGMVVNTAFKNGDDMYFYIKEQAPEHTESLSVITHPLIQLELEETPKKIYVYNLDTGEEFGNLDAVSQGRIELETKQTTLIEILKKS